MTYSVFTVEPTVGRVALAPQPNVGTTDVAARPLAVHAAASAPEPEPVIPVPVAAAAHAGDGASPPLSPSHKAQMAGQMLRTTLSMGSHRLRRSSADVAPGVGAAGAGARGLTSLVGPVWRFDLLKNQCACLVKHKRGSGRSCQSSSRLTPRNEHRPRQQLWAPGSVAFFVLPELTPPVVTCTAIFPAN